MNTISLVGRLTADPLQRQAADQPVTRLRIAVDRPGGEHTTFVDVDVWGTQGQACARHLTKGRRVAVTGRLDYSEWTDPDGRPRSRHYITAATVDWLDAPRPVPTADTPVPAGDAA